MAKPVRLKDQTVMIDAPRELIFQKMTAFNRGSITGDNNESSKVISKDGDSLVVEFKTKAGWFSYTTLEEVTLYPPERITFNHLKGPVHYSTEEFIFEDVDGETRLTHTGELTWSRFPFFGWLGGVIYTRPMWHKVIEHHLAMVKESCEARAARSHVFKRRKKEPSEPQK
jgi:hypothetical protein